jgi:hypothetical protein
MIKYFNKNSKIKVNMEKEVHINNSIMVVVIHMVKIMQIIIIVMIIKKKIMRRISLSIIGKILLFKISKIEKDSFSKINKIDINNNLFLMKMNLGKCIRIIRKFIQIT